MHLTWSFLVAALPYTAQCFEIAFYTGRQCTGQRLQTVELFFGDDCQPEDGLNSLASSACITRGPDDSASQGVAFYAGDTCDVNDGDGLIATANTGFVNVGSGIENFRSFKIIDGPSRHRASLAKRSEVTGIKHGDFSETNGEIWRWEQIARDSFRGVRPEDWVTANRLLDDEPLQFGYDYPYNFTAADELHGKPDYLVRIESQEDNESLTSANPANVLRRQNDGLCGIARQCANHISFALNYYFPQETRSVVNLIESARERATLDNIWIFMGRPIVLPFGIGLATGVIGARYWGNEPTCQNDDTQVLEIAIASGLLTQDQVQAIRSAINTGAGEVGDVSIALYETQRTSTANGCGAPNGDITHEPNGRFKRALTLEVPGYKEWLEERAVEIASTTL